MKLLVATDGSKNSLRGVRHAIALLKKLAEPGTITLISVHDDTALRHARRFVGKEAVDEYLRELSDADLADARKLLDKAGVKHDNIIRTGHVATEIANAADKGKYDMIADWWGVRGEKTAAMREHGITNDADLQDFLLRHSTKHTIVDRYKRQGFRATVTEDQEKNLNVELTRAY